MFAHFAYPGRGRVTSLVEVQGVVLHEGAGVGAVVAVLAPATCARRLARLSAASSGRFGSVNNSLKQRRREILWPPNSPSRYGQLYPHPNEERTSEDIRPILDPLARRRDKSLK
jgi:hypothetical protein